MHCGPRGSFRLWSGAGVELDGREADGLGLVINAEEERRLPSVDVDAHHHSIADGFGDDDFVRLDDAVVAGRTPILLELAEVVWLELARVLLPARIVVPLAEGLLEVAGLDGIEKFVDAVVCGPVPHLPGHVDGVSEAEDEDDAQYDYRGDGKVAGHPRSASVEGGCIE
jgi:hypothetical protein